MPLYIEQGGDLDRCYQCLTDSQTLKDSATQLPKKYRSGALVTQQEQIEGEEKGVEEGEGGDVTIAGGTATGKDRATQPIDATSLKRTKKSHSWCQSRYFYSPLKWHRQY